MSVNSRLNKLEKQHRPEPKVVITRCEAPEGLTEEQHIAWHMERDGEMPPHFTLDLKAASAARLRDDDELVFGGAGDGG